MVGHPFIKYYNIIVKFNAIKTFVVTMEYIEICDK